MFILGTIIYFLFSLEKAWRQKKKYLLFLYIPNIFMNKPKVLITGIAGFIGSNLADRLMRESYPVIGIDDLSYGLKRQIPKGIKFYKKDIRDSAIYPLFKGADIVFHLAAKNCLEDCQLDPVATASINVYGTVNVFEAANRAGVKRMIYTQSSAVEEGEKRARGFYAVSKISDELFAEGYEAIGLTTVGLRYFNVYGPRQDYRRTKPPIMSKLIITMLKGERPVLYEGDEGNKRDFVYIDDVNDFHMICLNDPRVDHKVFRIGSGQSYSIQEIYDTIKKLLGVNPEPIVKPRAANDPQVVTKADISEARRLGWQPKTSLETGLKAQIEYLQNL